MRLLQKLLAVDRRQPPEFRVPELQRLTSRRTSALHRRDMDELQDVLGELLRLLREPPEAEIDKALISGVATSIWRLRSRHRAVLESLQGEAPRAVQRLGNAIQMAEEMLRENGIEARDYCGQSHDPGMPYSVLTREERDDVGAATVVQTVAPTVYVHGCLVQRGEVVIGVPTPGGRQA